MLSNAQVIEKATTAKGGWTKKQLAAWGVSWPPPPGWKKQLIASDIKLDRKTREVWRGRRFSIVSAGERYEIYDRKRQRNLPFRKITSFKIAKQLMIGADRII